MLRAILLLLLFIFEMDFFFFSFSVCRSTIKERKNQLSYGDVRSDLIEPHPVK